MAEETRVYDEASRQRSLKKNIHVILKPFVETLEKATFDVFEDTGSMVRIHKAARALQRRATEIIYTRDVLDVKRAAAPRRPLLKVK